MGNSEDAIFPASQTGLSTAIAEVSHRAGHYRSTASLAVRASKRGGGEPYNFSGGGFRGSASGGTPSESVGGSAGMSGGTSYRAAEQYRYFRDYVYTAIRPIATRIAGQQIHIAAVTEQQMAKAFFAASRSFTSRDPAEHLFSLKRSLPDCFKQLGDNLEPIDDHPLKRILEWPNELMTGWAHIYTTVASLQLTGKANWWIDPLGGKSERRAGLPALWYMPVHWCEPKHGGGKLFERWEVASPGSSKKASVPGELMAYFSMPDPADPLSALAPLQSQAKAVATDEQIQTSQYASAKQGIRPGVIVKAGRIPDVRIDGDGHRPILTADQRNQLYAAISMAHEGAMQHGRPLIVDGLIEEVFPFTSSPTDMDYPGGSLLTKSRIMQGFGVNPIVAGQIENANRASAAVADQGFCFPPGTMVLAESGYVPIESVSAGDLVLSHFGRWRPVRRAMQRQFSGNLVSLTAVGHSSPVQCTPEHPFLVRSAAGVLSWRAASELQVGDLIGITRSRDAISPEIIVSEWINVEHYNKCWQEKSWLSVAANSGMSAAAIARTCGASRDAVCQKMREHKISMQEKWRYMRGEIATTNRPDMPSGSKVRVKGRGAISYCNNSVAVTREVAWMLGLWLAEGHVSGPCVGWTLHRKELQWKNRIEIALSEFGIDRSVHVSFNAKNSCQLVVGSSILARLLKSMFGSGASRKRIPSFVYRWPHELVRAFVGGYLAGDGCGGGKTQGVEFNSASKQLAYGMKSLLATLGVPCNVSQHKKSESIIRGRLLSSRTFYSGSVHGYDAIKVGRWFGRTVVKPKRNIRQSVVDDSAVWRKVNSVSLIPFSGTVHNISVAEDESYVTTIGTVHNCDNVINPLITLLSQTMTIALGSLFSGKQPGGKSSLGSRIVAWIEPARPRDDDLTLRQWTAAAAKGYVGEDEFRRFILNLPPKTDEQRQAELQRAQERMNVLSPGGGDAAGQPQGKSKLPPTATGNRNKLPKPKRTADQPGGKPDRKPSASSRQRQPVA